MKALIFDPFAGISGDMTLAALLDLGVAADWLRTFVRDLNLGDITVDVEKVQRCGIACTHVRFDLPHEHTHRHLKQVVEIIDRCNASDLTKERARLAFQRLAEAEAKVHGISVEQVHFHEVGALDAILDVLCSMAAIEQLGCEACYTRPVALGHGWIDIAHGRFPVPAPATLDLLAGFPTTGLDIEGECTTPTGAAILSALTNGQKAPESFAPIATGFGAGTRDSTERPNCLRIIAAEIERTPESLYVVQCDIDDLSAEYAAAAQQALLGVGALDAVILHVAMKKGRPGIRIEALTAPENLQPVLDTMFAATTSIGVRYWPVSRQALARSEDVVEWNGQRIRRKQVTLPDGTVRWKPEYEDVARAAETLGTTPLAVRQAVDRM